MSASILDPFTEALGKRYQSSRADYLRIVNDFPKLWSGIYRLVDALPVGFAAPILLSKLTKEIARAIRSQRPNCILSVYPLYTYLLPEALHLAGSPNIPLFTVITDSITINSIWHRKRCDGFIVPNPQSAEVLRAAGIPEHLILDEGFPVSPRFHTETVDRPSPSSSNPLKVLFMINGNRDRSRSIATRLLNDPDISPTITVGHDNALGEELASAIPQNRRDAHILGWVPDIPKLVRENHVLIGKAGGATVQESLAAVTPMIITQIFPGQEEGNARLLLENGCGIFASSADEISSSLKSIRSNDFKRWTELHAACRRLSRPEAALRIIERIRRATKPHVALTESALTPAA